MQQTGTQPAMQPAMEPAMQPAMQSVMQSVMQLAKQSLQRAISASVFLVATFSAPLPTSCARLGTQEAEIGAVPRAGAT